MISESYTLELSLEGYKFTKPILTDWYLKSFLLAENQTRPTIRVNPRRMLLGEKGWITFFINLLKHVIDLDFKMNGSWENLDLLEERIISLVIPQLIGVLEKDGRSIKHHA
jgi:hypothetical protein